jgi:hypothetical protein
MSTDHAKFMTLAIEESTGSGKKRSRRLTLELV